MIDLWPANWRENIPWRLRHMQAGEPTQRCEIVKASKVSNMRLTQ